MLVFFIMVVVLGDIVLVRRKKCLFLVLCRYVVICLFCVCVGLCWLGWECMCGVWGLVSVCVFVWGRVEVGCMCLFLWCFWFGRVGFCCKWSVFCLVWICGIWLKNYLYGVVFEESRRGGEVIVVLVEGLFFLFRWCLE